MKKKTALRRTVFSALMAALTAVATIVFTFPLPGNGYANLGDSFVILAAFILGPLWGGIAAALGACISDLILGYAIYAPATFVIKFLMGAVAAGIIKKAVLENGKKNALITFAAAVVSEVIMVSGYFLYELIIYTTEIAVVDIIGNCVQGAFSIAASLVIFAALKKTGALTYMNKAINR